MTTKYENKCFSTRVYWFNVDKTANKRNKKAFLITNLRNMTQCTNCLTVQSQQINININKLQMLKF